MTNINKNRVKDFAQGKPGRIILIIAIVVVLNLIAVHLFTRVDITRDKRYSISGYSKNLVKNLDDKFTIKAFFTNNIPYPYNTLARDVRDKLEEYKAFSNRYFQFEFVSAGDKTKFVQDARSFGIPEVQVNAIEKDEMVVKRVVMGLVLLYEDRTEVIPVVQSTENLEYEISSKINKLIHKELPIIGFLQGHGELSFENELRNIQKQLQENYQLKPINLDEDEYALNDLSVLVVPGPKEVIADGEKYLIDQFIMQGNHVIFLIDNINADPNTSKAEFYNNDMNEWFKGYGFNVERNLVFDSRAANIQVRQQFGRGYQISFMKYPFLINVENFNKNNMIVKDLNAITLIFASSINTSFAEEDSIEVISLAKSSKRAGIQKGRLNIAIQPPIPQSQYNKQDIPLASLLLGKFRSYFRNQELPDTLDTSLYLEKGLDSRILVVGDADFIRDDYLNKTNALFFTNSIDWLAQESGLIEIRSKNIITRELKEISGGAKNTVKWIAVLLPSILVVLIGFVAWRIKKIRYARIGRYF
ncbi:MAG: Gldg family protein [Candidatus Cloacimonadota bacterium]|nr:Gldg family protein [Candidatus Cloacimonadota bacterium]